MDGMVADGIMIIIIIMDIIALIIQITDIPMGTETHPVTMAQIQVVTITTECRRALQAEYPRIEFLRILQVADIAVTGYQE